MGVDWNGYELERSGVPRPLAPAPSAKDARAAFEKLMASKPERLRQLADLLAANGVALATSDEAIQALNDWYRHNVAADQAHPRALAEEWWSVTRDISLFLGDTMIARNPGLAWRYYSRPPVVGIGYRRPVIMGFADPNYYEYPELMVSGYGHSLLGTLRVRDPTRFRCVVNVSERVRRSPHASD